MLSINVSFNTRNATSGLKKSIDQAVRGIATDLFKTIKRYTPVRSGRARKNWRMTKKSKSNYEVRNKVPYIERLDAGYSKQSPKGMTRPSLREVLTRNRSRRIR
jgi:hypothetical protein|tara:strand:- start:202 stop:513 length:312 start_codon:yes stop_codon:yes gene_type:complete